jgi:hypothetical protein
MAALNITDADVDAEIERRGLAGYIPPDTRRAIHRDLAQRAMDARKADRTPSPPDHLTVVIQVRHGDVVLSTSEQNIPLPNPK